ncbi:hypothetical protein LCGC14_2308020, partial [marine sediment metagenome]
SKEVRDFRFVVEKMVKFHFHIWITFYLAFLPERFMRNNKNEVY